MKSRPERLAQDLRKHLHPVYLVAGDDPLLSGEAADTIRAAAREAGYTERELLVAERAFDWDRLLELGNSLSLFGDKRLLELRLPTGKPGDAGARALKALAAAPPPDTVLLVISAKLDRRTLGTGWAKALESAGVLVEVWPVDAARLPAWIAGRMREAGLQPGRDAAQLLAERVEGNLLAAKQEIEKLALLHGTGEGARPLEVEDIAGAVADSSRFDIFKLVDAALAGDALRSQKILDGLRGEGVEPILVNWALARELRQLAGMAWQVERGKSVQQVTAKLWQKRKAPVAAALRRLAAGDLRAMLMELARVDRVIKGVLPGRPWDDLQRIVAGFAGLPLGLKRPA